MSTGVEEVRQAVAGEATSLAVFRGPAPEFIARLLELQRRVTGAEHAVALRLSADRRSAELVGSAPALSSGQDPPQWIRRVVGWASESGVGPATPIPLLPGVPASTPQDIALVIPRNGPDGGPRDTVFAMVVRGVTGGQAAAMLLPAGLTLGVLDAYEANEALRRRERDVEMAASALATVEAVHQHDRFTAAAMALANEVAARWRCTRVSVGVRRNRYVELIAMSHTEHLVRKTRLARDIESSMEECADQDIEVIWPEPEGGDVVTRMTARFDATHGPSSIVSLPMRRAGEVVGVLMVERDRGNPLDVGAFGALRVLCDVIASPLHELSRHDRWVGARALSGVRRLAEGLVGPRHAAAKLAAILGALTLGVLVFGRGTDWAESPFTVEVTRRQIITAPFEGYLAAVDARIDDRVSGPDQVLLRMDTTDLVLRLTRLRSELETHRREASTALRDGDIPARDVAAARAAASEAEIRLVEAQLARAAVASPIGGVIISGEPERRIGGAVRQGEELFQVAPIDALRAELRVPAERIGDVEVGQAGELAAASHPTRRIPIRVERIDPVAEVVGTQNVFRVIATLDGEAPSWLRPGVEGVARLDAGRAPLGWLVIRGAVNWVRARLWI